MLKPPECFNNNNNIIIFLHLNCSLQRIFSSFFLFHSIKRKYPNIPAAITGIAIIVIEVALIPLSCNGTKT
jgi:hypothetical protein